MAEKHLKLHIDRCKGCGLCVHSCPKGVLGLENDRLNEKGYRPVAVINPDKCIYCGMCSVICPDLAILLVANSEKEKGVD